MHAELLVCSRSTASVRQLRASFGLTQTTMARLLGVSLRTMASLEADKQRSTVPRNLHECRRLLEALADIIRREHIRAWLDEPAESLGGLKPLEVVERGQVDRLWDLIYRLASGEPV